MNICVINGSPKGKQSITLQHIRYWMKKHPEHTVDIVHVSAKIIAVEKNRTLFDEITGKMAAADAVVWSFPVYYALIPSQLKRFVELLFERCRPGLFKDKYTSAFTTSINYFDHTAHNYMQGVCEDLGFRYVKSYSAHMHDFFDTDKREKMNRFFQWFIQMVEQHMPVPRKYGAHRPATVSYEPAPLKDAGITSDLQILLLTDGKEEDRNLNRMVDVFQKSTSMAVRVCNIHEIPMKNGCLGCCTCGYDNTCKQKDGFTQFFNDNLKAADIIVIAGTIRDHYLSSTWKRFFDRSFFNGHAPVLMGKRLGFIISGPLSGIQNLREQLELFGEGWHMKTTGIVTDEYGTSEEITTQIHAFAKELDLMSQGDVEFGSKFYRVAGAKLFRDFIFNASAVFSADHRFYKARGFYRDFPQRRIKKRVNNAIFSLFLSVKPLRKRIQKRFIPGMVAPYKKILKES